MTLTLPLEYGHCYFTLVLMFSDLDDFDDLPLLATPVNKLTKDSDMTDIYNIDDDVRSNASSTSSKHGKISFIVLSLIYLCCPFLLDIDLIVHSNCLI